MSATTLIILIGILLFLSWVVYQIQKRIGEEQSRDWAKFVKDNPHLFKKPEPPIGRRGTSAENQKKST